MKITKSRLLQIIREEVELHEKNTLEIDEEFLEELTDKQEKEILDAAEEDMEGDKDDEENLEEVETVTHKGKTYKASDATMKAIRSGGGGPGKVTPAEFKKAAKQAKSWADDPEAVAAAGRIVAKKKAGTMEEADVEEDQLIDPQSKEVVEPPEKSGKIEIKIR